jgi:multiple sugar transport system substrate-binding protein
MPMGEERLDRRQFLRLTGGAAAVAAAGVLGACGSGSKKQPSAAATKTSGPGGGERTLRVSQWAHFVPGFDDWFDNEFARRWGEEHDIEVIVDHVPFNEATARADTEAARGEGHDVFGFVWASSARFEDQTLDHGEIVEEVRAKLGSMHPLVEQSIFNPKTKRYVGVSPYWVPNVSTYRRDVWEALGSEQGPKTYDDLLRAGPRLKTLGHPLGLSLGEGDPDADEALMALMFAYGAFIQDEEANLTIDGPATVEAVKMMTAIYRSGLTAEVLAWDGASNNRYLASGTGSLIINPISAIRAIEKQDPELAAKVGLAPLPAGPAGNQAPYIVSTNVVWKFARNPEAAKQFLVDLALASRELLVRSEFYNLPSFPASIPDLPAVLAGDTAKPAGKYSFLADAQSWTTNLGHPGPANAAAEEVFEQAIVVRMFAAAARGELSAEEAVKRAHAQAVPIFDKWRERGKI